MQICNVVETMVWENIDAVMDSKQMCRCPKCRADVAAFALNNLQPRYTVSQMGTTITRTQVLSQSVVTSILVALARAVEIVSSNPRHDGEVNL
ncbi:MAG TPA: late competence development ComFB family protein [Syntrophomonadaceae bacterium]|nr:late competence development ComFB family protein [Syntrophomonadaceae bacterium]